MYPLLKEVVIPKRLVDDRMDFLYRVIVRPLVVTSPQRRKVLYSKLPTLDGLTRENFQFVGRL